MTNKMVNCVVLAVGEGPLCEDCSQPMDLIQIEMSEKKFAGEEGYYCSHCISTKVK